MKNQLRKIVVMLVIFSMVINVTLEYTGNIAKAAQDERVADNPSVETAGLETETEPEEHGEEEEVMDAEEAEEKDIAVAFQLTEKWESHYNADITIENISKEKINNWALRFAFDNEIEHIWNGSITSQEENVYTVKNAGWNQDIEPGETVTFGITVKYDVDILEPYDYEMPICYTESEKEYEVTYEQFSKWGNQLNGQVTITNPTDERIEDWKLDFEGNIGITQIWNGEIEQEEEGAYTIGNKGYNQNIEPHSSVSFGFIATCEDDGMVLSDYVLYEVTEYDESEIDYEEEEYYDPYKYPGLEEDDFETEEEYEAYMRKFESADVVSTMTRMALKATKKIASYNTNVKPEADPVEVKASMKCKIVSLPEHAGQAAQNFCVCGDYIFVVQRVKQDAYLSRCSYGGVTQDGVKLYHCEATMTLEGFGHTETLEKIGGTNKNPRFMMTCNPYEKDNKRLPNDFTKDIGFVTFKKGENAKYSKVPRLTDLQYANAKQKAKKGAGRIFRCYAAKNGSNTLCIWAKHEKDSEGGKSKDILISTMDFDKIYKLAKKGNGGFSFKRSKETASERKTVKKAFKSSYYQNKKYKNWVYPSASFQSIDLWGTNSVYFTSGGEKKSSGKNRGICIGRMTAKKSTTNYKKEIHLTFPKGLDYTYKEIEGMKVEDEKITFMIAPSYPVEYKNSETGEVLYTDKLPQYLFTIDRSKLH